MSTTPARSTALLLLLLSTTIFSFACSVRPVVTEGTVQKPGEAIKSDIDMRSDWQKEWDSLVEAAKKEGKVVIYGTSKPEAYAAISEGFKKSFGIEIETVVGRSAQVIAKIKMENTAGLHLADVALVGGATAVLELGPLGVLAKIDDFIILPEIKNNSVWYKGSMEKQILDPTHFSFTFIAGLDIPMARNTRMVTRDEIRTWEDLLQDKWKGKLLVNDPTTTGKGQSNFAMIGKMKGWDFWRALVQQNPVILRDTRLQTDWLARGRYPLLISPSTSAAQEFIDAGAPVGFIRLKEGNYTTSSGGVVNIFKRAPHPNATKVFLNYLLSREGQTFWSKADGVQSARLDVPPEGLDPIRVREPGVMYPASDDWEFYMWREKNKVEEIALEIFGPVLK